MVVPSTASFNGERRITSTEVPLHLTQQDICLCLVLSGVKNHLGSQGEVVDRNAEAMDEKVDTKKRN